MEDNKKEKKATSRKWIVTVWSMIVGTVIIGILGFCAFTGKDIPDGFIGLATLLFTTGIAYIGGSVWQKQIFARKSNNE